jgi:hypothetical protein
MINEKYSNEDVPIQDTFYMQKFMEIQRQNVVLSNKLRDLYEILEIRGGVEMHFGDKFFNILNDTPA